jgi:hypothetical protein
MRSFLRLALWASLCCPSLFANQTATGPIKVPPGDLAIEPSAGDQTQPAIASGAGASLVVWSDNRSPVGSTFKQTGRDIYALRLGPGGQALAPDPLVISAAFGDQTDPRVSWNGEHWLVTWVSQVPTQFFYEFRLQAIRVGADGSLLDAAPLSLPMASTSSVSNDLCNVGSQFVLVSQSSAAGEGGIRAVRISSAGTLLDPVPATLVPSTFFLYFDIQVNGTDSQFLLSYSANNGFKGQRFQADLTPLDATFNLPSSRVAGKSDGYLLVWQSGSGIVCSPLGLAGGLTFPSGVPVTPGPVLLFTYADAIAFDGQRWWLAWTDVPTGVRLARVDPSGNVVDPGGFALDAADKAFQDLPKLGGLPGGGVQAVWSKYVINVLGQYDVFGQSVAANAAVGPRTTLPRGLHSQTRTELAKGPADSAMLTTLSRSADQFSALAWPTDSFGNPTGGPLILATGGNLSNPAAAWNGQQWLFAWADNGQIFARRYSANLTALDAQPVLVMGGFSLDVEALGDDFLVVGTDYGFSVQFLFVYARRMDGPTGQFLDAQRFGLSQYFAQLPRVSTLAGRWIVVWQRNFSHDDPQSSVESALIDPNGAIVVSPVVLFATGGQPDVVGTNDKALIAYRSNSLANANNEVHARLMNADGSFATGTLVLCNLTGRQLDPAVAWNGQEFTVVWEDMRNQAAFFDERTELYGGRVSVAGALLDGQGFPVLTGSPAMDPAALGLGGDVLVAGARLDLAPGVVSYRSALRRLSRWSDLGQGLAGTQGVPVLDGAGALAAGQSLQLALVQGPANGLGALVVGLSNLSLPFLGGTLVPFPDALEPLATDANGAFSVSFPVQSNFPSGLPLYVQIWLADQSAPQGFSASNALGTNAP